VVLSVNESLDMSVEEDTGVWISYHWC